MNFLFILIALLPVHFVSAQVPNFKASEASFHKVLRDLVKAKMVNPPGNEKKGVDIIAARLKKENIPFQTMSFGKNRSNLVARLKGSGEKKPLLLLAHIDVVGVDNQTWTYPPHDVTEKDGFLYGRGVQDDLGMAVANLETFILLKKLKVKLKRDIILAFTGDEESGGAGIKALLKVHPEWIADAEIGLNEGGSPITDDQQNVKFINLAAAEKTYQDFTLTVEGATGHSSLPHGDNAIFVLTEALEKLSQHQPNLRLLPVTREYFRERATIEPPPIANAMKELVASKGQLPSKALAEFKKHPYLYVQLMTTCIPTMINGGSRVNALPPLATANINCRILPDETTETVRQRLVQIFADSRVQVKAEGDFSSGGASDVNGVVPTATRKIAQQMWPNKPVIASMLMGATDSRFLQGKIQMYGISPLYRLEKDAARAHGIDERIPKAAVLPGLEFFYKLIVEIAEHS
jgi:acetylornithine deacetylase/succinyl-diaminopimelate desuccinylase-like protein